jgi:hypothetical protein
MPSLGLMFFTFWKAIKNDGKGARELAIYMTIIISNDHYPFTISLRISQMVYSVQP